MHTFTRAFIHLFVCCFVLFNGYLQAGERQPCVGCGCCPKTKIIAISAGNDFSMALRSNGTVWTWGLNDQGQLGNGITGGNFDLPGQVVTKPDRCHSFRRVKAISAGGAHALALRNDGTVWAWGNNISGQLGIGSTGSFSTVPLQVINLPPNIQAIAAGLSFSLALDSDGIVWAWGNNQFGQLGTGGVGAPNPFPAPIVAFPLSVTTISAGGAHSLALLSNGAVWAWGSDAFGQLGDGITGGSPAPVAVTATELTSAIAISAGFQHSLAIKSDGTAWSWGRNNEGQLGNGITGVNSNVPVQVTPVFGFTNVIAIGAGGGFSLAITSDHTIWSWGNNNRGQLGNGGVADSNVPVQVVTAIAGPPFTNAIAISAGQNHALALKQHPRDVFAWGDNTFGELGNGTTGGFSNIPVEVQGL